MVFETNAGEGRYTFQYNEYAVDAEGTVISDSLPPGLFSVTCLLDGQPSTDISYSLGGGDGLFQVDPISGALSLQDGMELDYEVMVDIQFSVTCSAPSAARDGTAQVDFSILPVNEFPPVLSTRTLFARVREDLAIGTALVSTRNDVNAIVTFSATDEDDGPDGALIYALTFSENLTSFSVDESSGTLRVTQSLDVDNTPFGFAVQTIRLTVCDINPAVPSCPSVEVSLVITSTNDNNPVFEQNAYEVSILENVPSGFIIANVSCTDADVGAGAFENVTSSLDLFNVTLQPSEQVISLSGTLDFETARSHNVSLICSDFAGGIARASLMVTVDPVNDNNPVFEQNAYEVNILENVPSGFIIANVSCTDADVGAGEFENVTSSLDLFNVTLQPSEQVISLSGTLDFETARLHNVSIICSDFAGGIARASLLVTVDPVNDNQPRFTKEEFFFSMSRLLTTGNQIGTVVAIDEDEEVGDDLTYTMMENENFRIQNDGTIILSDFVYVVEGQVFELTVTVSDGEFSDSSMVVITVAGVLNVPEIVVICVGVFLYFLVSVILGILICYCVFSRL